MSFVVARRTERMNPSVIGEILNITEPAGIDAASLLPKAVALGKAHVPGVAFYAAFYAAFHAAIPQHNALRPSFVTVSPERITQGVRATAKPLKETV